MAIKYVQSDFAAFFFFLVIVLQFLFFLDTEHPLIMEVANDWTSKVGLKNRCM